MVTVPAAVPVPPVGVSPGFWHVSDDGLTSRSARARGTGPYEVVLPNPLADRALTIPLELGGAVSDAERALVRYDALAFARLGAGNAAVGPMSSILLRTESASSSRIEDLTVGARRLALAELQESRSANATAVLANVRTMEAALRLADTLNLKAILAMHRELLAGSRGTVGQEAGQLRSSLVWVGKDGSSPRHAAHIAPEAEDVPAAMTALVTFIGRQDLPVLVHAAIAHAQFETIHPFADGNGRTGRALVHAMLHGKGLLTRQTAPVSSGLLHRHGDYVEALTAFRRGDAGPAPRLRASLLHTAPPAQVPSAVHSPEQPRRCEPTRWVSTIPIASMRANMVVGPMKRKPRALSSAASARDSGDVVGTSAAVRGTGVCWGRCDHTKLARSDPGPSQPRRFCVARALLIVASILPRCRMIPRSPNRRSTSRSSNPATASTSKPAKARRKPSRRRRIVAQESPDWNPSSARRSNTPVSDVTGIPHSVS